MESKYGINSTSLLVFHQRTGAMLICVLIENNQEILATLQDVSSLLQYAQATEKIITKILLYTSPMMWAAIFFISNIIFFFLEPNHLKWKY